MAADEKRTKNDGDVDDRRPMADPVHTDEEFFDRERWHDVETDDESPSGDPPPHVSPFSIAVLLLIAVIAGGAGLIAAYLIPILFAPQQLPRQRIDYRSTPKLWIGYIENSSFFCEVNEPTAFTAAQDGTVYLGDANPPTLKIHASNGNLIRAFTLEDEPTAVALDDRETTKRLYIAMPGRLTRYSTEGQLLATWPLPNENADVRSLASDGRNLFVADSKNKLVYRFDETGQCVGTIGQKPEKFRKTESDKNVSIPEAIDTFGGFTIFLAPMTLTISKKTGLLHVANPGLHRIETFTPEGHWEPSLSWQNSSADVTGFCGCCNPVAIDTLSDGRIVTSEKDVTRVKVYRPDGRLDCVVAGPEVLGKKPLNIPQLQELQPMAGEDKKSVFIAAVSDQRVIVFDPVWRTVRIFVPTEPPSHDKHD